MCKKLFCGWSITNTEACLKRYLRAAEPKTKASDQRAAAVHHVRTCKHVANTLRGALITGTVVAADAFMGKHLLCGGDETNSHYSQGKNKVIGEAVAKALGPGFERGAVGSKIVLYNANAALQALVDKGDRPAGEDQGNKDAEPAGTGLATTKSVDAAALQRRERWDLVCRELNEAMLQRYRDGHLAAAKPHVARRQRHSSGSRRSSAPSCSVRFASWPRAGSESGLRSSEQGNRRRRHSSTACATACGSMNSTTRAHRLCPWSSVISPDFCPGTQNCRSTCTTA